MRCSTSVFTLFTSAVIAVIAVTALGAPLVFADPAVTIHAQSLDTRPESRREGAEAMDAAVAAAVIGAVAEQFGEHDVAVKLDKVAVNPASVRDRAVSGDGRLQIGGDLDWIAFEFSALYDTVATTISYPQLKLGGAPGGQQIAGNSKIALALSDKVDAALRNEFPQQPVEMLLQYITTSPAGNRYLQVNGVGTVDFGVEGTTAAQVEALYDRRNSQWLRLDYELGTTSNWADRPAASVAVH